MKLGDVSDIAASGLAAQRARLAVTASNLANAETTRTERGGPYRRQDPVFAAEKVAPAFANALDRALHKVEVERVSEDPRPPIQRYQPGHPDADEQGFVALPHVEIVEEMANMIAAARSFQANLLTLAKVREITDAALQIGR